MSNLAAKRAKQLREGAPPLVQIESNHPLTIALAEIVAGKIKAIMPDPQAEVFEIPETAVLVEETVPGELGMLLPALDETETALISGVVHGEDDHDADAEEHDPETMSLSDLVGEEEEHEEVAAASEEDTLSLSDIAEQESSEEEPEE